MKRFTTMLCLAASVVMLSGCYTLKHNIGTGASPDAPTVAGARQWYVLWGLVPINHVDGGAMAKEKGLSTNYTVKSQMSVLDFIINCFTNFVTVQSRSVNVIGSPSASAAIAAPAALPVASADELSLGNQAMQVKDFQGAIKHYQAATMARPNSAEAFQGLGTAYYYAGQKKEALAAFQTSLKLNPSNAALANTVKSMQ